MFIKLFRFWPDCKAIPAYGLMMSVCPSVRLSVCPSTFWLTSAFKFVLGHINQYRLDTLHWIDLGEISLTATFPCDLDFSVQGHLIILVNPCV